MTVSSLTGAEQRCAVLCWAGLHALSCSSFFLACNVGLSWCTLWRALAANCVRVRVTRTWSSLSRVSPLALLAASGWAFSFDMSFLSQTEYPVEQRVAHSLLHQVWQSFTCNTQLISTHAARCKARWMCTANHDVEVDAGSPRALPVLRHMN